jgi:hypothetical protein
MKPIKDVMGDIADQANDTADLFLQEALTHKKEVAPDYTGYCHYCHDPVPGNLRWCDMDCRDDWEKHQRAIKHAAIRD